MTMLPLIPGTYEVSNHALRSRGISWEQSRRKVVSNTLIDIFLLALLLSCPAMLCSVQLNSALICPALPCYILSCSVICYYWKRSLRTFSTVFTLNMKKILPMIDCSLSITRFVT